MFYAQRQALNRPLFQHVSACYTHTIVVLDTDWPWASEAYGLCSPFVRIMLYAQGHTALSSCRSLPQACYKVNSGYSPNRDSYGVLAANKNELAALSKGCRCWCWCCGPGCWCCELAERAFKTGGAISWLCRLRAFLLQPVACQQVVGFCLAIWVYAGVIYLIIMYSQSIECQ